MRRYRFFVLLLVSLLAVLLVPLPASLARPPTYGTLELVLSGLNEPIIVGKAPMGIFLTIRNVREDVLYFYSASTGELIRILQEEGAIRDVNLFGNCIYYLHEEYEGDYWTGLKS